VQANPEQYLEVAFRAWTGGREKQSNRGKNYPVRRILVIDTETTTDTRQSLMFGFARLARINWHERNDGTYSYQSHETELEVCFHADSLEASDPDGYRLLKEYTESQHVTLVSRTVFMEEYIRRYCLVRQGSGGKRYGMATLAGFNLPFDLSRLAYRCGVSRDGSSFSLTMFPDWQGKENQFRPRLKIRHLDSKKSLMQWTGDQNGDYPLDAEAADTRRWQMLDLRQLIWGMTNESTSLAFACRMFGLPDEYSKTHAEEYGKITPAFIGYARQDVLATTELAVKVLAEYMRHPIDLQASKVFSAASIAKAYLRQMGITPMLDRKGVPSDPAIMGRCVSTFYGGRAEAHIRNVVVPVTVCDFTSMYPTVNSLMKLWDHVTAAKILAVSNQAEVKRFASLASKVARTGAQALLDPAVWPSLTGFAQIIPDGDILPVRARYGEATWNVGINRFHCSQPVWYTMADVLASCLLTGKAPEIVSVLRFVPCASKVSGLKPVKLGGTVPVDPSRDDFFRTVVEQRAAIKAQVKAGKAGPEGSRAAGALKVLANSGSYGIYVEMLRDDEAPSGPAQAHGIYPEPWQCKPNAVETAREFCYPPIGAVITGAARLMLALLERLVTDQGGTWLFCDTDSMAILTGQENSLVPCPGGSHRMPDGRDAVKPLTRGQVQKIRDTINALNPYDRTKVPELLKDETADTNRTGQVYGLAISAKRYCLFTYGPDGRPVVPHNIDGKDAYMQHALGLYLNPADAARPGERDWIRQTWQYMVDKRHGLNPALPGWASSLALSQITASTPHTMRAFKRWNEGSDYDGQVKPFNFVLLASEFRGGMTELPDALPLRLLAPFETSPARWIELDWTDLSSPAAEPVRVSGAILPQPGLVRVKTHRTVLFQYANHPEAKSAMLDGKPCAKSYAGVLSRRIVRPSAIKHIGKESNRIDDVENGSIRHADEVYTSYDRDDRRPVTDAFRGLSARQITELVNAESASLLRQESKHCSSDAHSVTVAQHRTSHGYPVKVNDKMIGRYFKGSSIRDTHQEQAIIRTAAKHVAAKLDVDPATIGYGQGLTSPETVLAMWRDRP